MPCAKKVVWLRETSCSLNCAGTTMPLQVYSIANFKLFATLLTSLLTAFIPSHGTTFDKGLDGLGKVDSYLKYSESVYLFMCTMY